MRLTGNFLSELGYAGQSLHYRHALSIAMVATAVGAVASSSVVLSLMDAPPATPDVPLTSMQALTSNTAATDAATRGEDPSFKTTARDVAMTQTKAAHEASMWNWRKEVRIGTRAHKFHWSRFAHTHSPDGSILSER